MEDVIVEYGTDINSTWSFKDGDIEIISNKDNLTQAITNRLNTINDGLDLFYTDYGSYLRQYFGWHKNNETLEFIKAEIAQVISMDPRISVFTIDLEYNSDGDVIVKLSIDGSDYVLELNENGVNEVNV